MMRNRLVRVFLPLCLGLLTAGCSNKAPKAADYNVVLIVLDTLRADYVTAFNGKSLSKTPNLDRLAREGTVFTKAFTTVPFTLPAHASLMTSRYPAQLGIRRNGRNSLAPEEETLAEILHTNGFSTGAVIGAFPVASVYGLNQGFEYFGEDFLNFYGSNTQWSTDLNNRRNGEDVNQEVFRWLDQHLADRFFLWVHYYDAHSPFHLIPEEYRFRYPGKPYAGAVEYVDKLVGLLLARLKSKGLMDNTLIVVCSDHGEGLGDHGEKGHAFFVYNSTIHIPLILYGKNLIPVRKIEHPVSILDITPTILNLLNIKTDNKFEGKQLASMIFGDADPDDRLVYSETVFPLKAFGWSPLFSVTDGRWKFIEAPRPELYRITDDFGESDNLFLQQRDVAENMQSRLHALISAQRQVGTSKQNVSLDSAALKRLQSLGYVGGDLKIEKLSDVDPKDRIAIYEKFVEATQLISAGKNHEAVTILQSLIRLEQDNPAFLAFYAKALTREGRLPEAVAILKHALRIDSDYFYAVQNLSQIYERQKKYGKAVNVLQKYISRNSGTIVYQYELWNLYIRIGKWEKALSEMKGQSEIDPGDVKLQLKIANILINHQRYKEAVLIFNQILQTAPALLEAREGLAKTFLLMGHNQEAKTVYLQIVEADPNNYEAHLNLGMAYSKLGEFAEGVASCRRALNLKPDNVVIQFDYAYLLLLNGNLQEALNSFDKVLVKDPSNWKVPMALGLWFQKHGRYEEARSEFEKGMKMRPGDDRFIKLLQELQG